MIHKQILPESYDFGVPSVELIGVGSKGLDKSAMVKRASAFDDVLDKLEKKANRTYLHVITTGASEVYGANLNSDAYNGHAFDHVAPYPEKGVDKVAHLDGGLSKYHDITYMKDGAVYQEHQTKRAGVEPSGEIIAARYNEDMHRGELIIAVDTEKWAPRLQKKASGKNIYLSIGCSVPYDICSACHHMAKTASEHCDHFNKMRGQVLDDGSKVCVYNDKPSFYDISGVDVPADRIAFVLQKVASGATVKQASVEALSRYVIRPAMLYTKAASILDKLSKMEKRISAMVDDGNADVYMDNDDAEDDFLSKVENWPAEEVIDNCSRKGLLLSPKMLFRLMGKDCEDGEGKAILLNCDDDSCGDCSRMMSELEEDDERNDELLDGAFDNHVVPDLQLDNLLEAFMPEFGCTNPAIHTKIIKITITGKPKKQHKEASLNKYAQDALRKTYARYLVSFAEQNDDTACWNALRKCSQYGR